MGTNDSGPIALFAPRLARSPMVGPTHHVLSAARPAHLAKDFPDCTSQPSHGGHGAFHWTLYSERVPRQYSVFKCRNTHSSSAPSAPGKVSRRSNSQVMWLAHSPTLSSPRSPSPDRQCPSVNSGKPVQLMQPDIRASPHSCTDCTPSNCRRKSLPSRSANPCALPA